MPQHFFVGFTGDKPILTAEGYKRIESIKPGVVVQRVFTGRLFTGFARGSVESSVGS